jgi:hypothetical protein
VRAIADDSDDLAAVVPVTGSAGAGVRVQPINAGFKQPRAAISDTDPLPSAAPTITLDEDGFTARVSWPTPPLVRAISDDADDLPATALDDEGLVVRAAWPLAAPVRAIADDDDLPVTPDPVTGSAPAGIRVQPLNAGFKAPRQPIAEDDDLPVAATPTLVDDDEGVTPRVLWPALPSVRAMVDDDDLPVAAAPSVPLDEGDGEFLATHAPAEFLVTHPTGFGAMDEAILAARDDDDGFVVPAPWRSLHRRPEVALEQDEVPTAAPADPVTGSAGAGTRVQPLNAGFKRPAAPIAGDDDAPEFAAPPPISADEEGTVQRATWPLAVPVRAITDDDDLPIAAAPTVSLDEGGDGLVGSHAPADFLVSHPTGFGAATEEFVRAVEPNDAWTPPAPWTTTRAPQPVADDATWTYVPSAPLVDETDHVVMVRPWPNVVARRMVVDDASEGEYLEVTAPGYQGKYRPEWASAGRSIAEIADLRADWTAARESIAEATDFRADWQSARDSVGEAGR